MKFIDGIGTALVLLISFGSPLGAQVGDADRREQARTRWEAMSELKREQFQERLVLLRQMKPEERQALSDRADDLERRKLEMFDRLSPEAKRRLAALSEESRDDLLREYFNECERVRGRRMREQLPVKFLQELEAVPPDERRSLMREFRDQMQDQAGDRMLGHMRREMSLPPEVAERLEGLSGRERRSEMLKQVQIQIRKRVEESGPPPGMSTEEWQELDVLPFDEFIAAWSRRREQSRRDFEEGAGPDGRFRRGPSGRGPFGGREGRPRRGDFSESGERQLRGERPDRRGKRERPDFKFGQGRRPDRGGPSGDGELSNGRLLDHLDRLVHPKLEDLLEFAELSTKERRKSVSALVYERCMKFLETNALFEADQMENLRQLSNKEFVRAIRSHVGQARGSRWSDSEQDRGDQPPR